MSSGKQRQQLKAAQDKARTFFKKKAEQSEEKKNKFNTYRFDVDEKLYRCTIAKSS